MNFKKYVTWVLITDKLSVDEKNNILNVTAIRKYLTISEAMIIVSELSTERQKISEICNIYKLIENKCLRNVLMIEYFRTRSEHLTDEEFTEVFEYLHIRKSNRKLIGRVIPILGQEKHLIKIENSGLLYNDRLKFNYLRRCLDLGLYDIYHAGKVIFNDDSVERKKLDILYRHLIGKVSYQEIELELYSIDEPYFHSYKNNVKKPWEMVEKNRCFFDLRGSKEQREQIDLTIKSSIKKQKKFLMLRLGDGECYGFSESSSLSERQEKHWWGGSLSVDLRNEIKESFTHGIRNTEIDVLAIPSPNKYIHYINYLSLPFSVEEPLEQSVLARNACVDNSIVDLIEQGYFKSSLLCDDQINKYFLDSDKLSDYISLAETVYIITGKTKDSVLNSLSNYKDKLVVVEIPTHNLNRFKSGENKNGTALPFVYNDILAELDVVKPGDLCLISAGFIGKIFALKCASNNAVAIDIGQAINELVS